VSQRQITNTADIRSTVIVRIERGEVNFGIDYLQRLAQALGIPASSRLPTPTTRSPVHRR
jgi:transcriptional regulator with XRE-family HTH domain